MNSVEEQPKPASADAMFPTGDHLVLDVKENPKTWPTTKKCKRTARPYSACIECIIRQLTSDDE